MADFRPYQATVEANIVHFETDIKTGLREDKVKGLLEKYGANTLQSVQSTSALVILLRQFASPFIVLLFAAAAISYYIEGPLQAIFLLLIITINLALGFFQELKAEKSIEDLKKTYHASTQVIRSGFVRKIENDYLVPGDLVELTAGNKVPADIRIVYSQSLSIDESTLSGESLPVDKTTDPVALDATLTDRKNMVYAGTLIGAGHGRGIVVATGRATEFGKIAELVETSEDKTPLEKQIVYLSKNFGLVAVVFAAIIFILGQSRGMEIWELLAFTIVLLVSMVPESLPTAITLALSLGVSRMAKRKAIIRRLAVTETLGSIDIIATDKTGTLTNNNLEIGKIFLYEESSFLESDGTSGVSREKTNQFLVESLACSNINLNKLENEDFIGDPVDEAIAKSAEKFDKNFDSRAAKIERLLEIPFDSVKKYMAVLVREGSINFLIAKGSTEVIIDFCELSATEKKEIIEKAEEYSRQGYKVIALSSRKTGGRTDDVLAKMEFRGLIALVDEPAKGVKEAIRQTISAGIRPIIITGDHPETARFIATKVGLEIADDEIISQAEFAKLDDKELRVALSKVKIFARVTPEDKIRIVESLKASGYCVAVTGDGTNDAPALKGADVGFAMGRRGTDVAKDAADIVLSDDRYSTIVAAVKYGRAIYDNIRNVVVLLVSGNFNEVLLIIAAFVFALPVPLTTIQILWANMITESLNAVTLSYEKPSSLVLAEKPRSSKAHAINPSLGYALKLAAVSFLLGLTLYLWGLDISIAKARTLVFSFLVFVETAYAFSIRSHVRIWTSPRRFFENKYLILSSVAVLALQLIIFHKSLTPTFGIVPLSLSEVGVLALFVAIAFVVAELIRSHQDRKRPS